jgi:hypothetical protein
LGIPKSRIDEGFAITDDMDESAIVNHLNVVATNYKALNLQERRPFGQQLEQKDATPEELKAVAGALVKH